MRKKRNKKSEIRDLKKELRICQSKLYLLQATEHLLKPTYTDNLKLKYELDEVKAKLKSSEGVVFNCQINEIAW